MDYDSGPYTVTFPAGQTIATFNVPINDDVILDLWSLLSHHHYLEMLLIIKLKF